MLNIKINMYKIIFMVKKQIVVLYANNNKKQTLSKPNVDIKYV